MRVVCAGLRAARRGALLRAGALLCVCLFFRVALGAAGACAVCPSCCALAPVQAEASRDTATSAQDSLRASALKRLE